MLLGFEVRPELIQTKANFKSSTLEKERAASLRPEFREEVPAKRAIIVTMMRARFMTCVRFPLEGAVI